MCRKRPDTGRRRHSTVGQVVQTNRASSRATRSHAPSAMAVATAVGVVAPRARRLELGLREAGKVLHENVASLIAPAAAGRSERAPATPGMGHASASRYAEIDDRLEQRRPHRRARVNEVKSALRGLPLRARATSARLAASTGAMSTTTSRIRGRADAIASIEHADQKVVVVERSGRGVTHRAQARSMDVRMPLPRCLGLLDQLFGDPFALRVAAVQ